MFELENLFELVKDGAFSSKEEFLSVAKNLSSNELFSILKEGSFGSVEELESILKKKKILRYCLRKMVYWSRKRILRKNLK